MGSWSTTVINCLPDNCFPVEYRYRHIIWVYFDHYDNWKSKASAGYQVSPQLRFRISQSNPFTTGWCIFARSKVTLIPLFPGNKIMNLGHGSLTRKLGGSYGTSFGVIFVFVLNFSSKNLLALVRVPWCLRGVEACWGMHGQKKPKKNSQLTHPSATAMSAVHPKSKKIVLSFFC